MLFSVMVHMVYVIMTSVYLLICNVLVNKKENMQLQPLPFCMLILFVVPIAHIERTTKFKALKAGVFTAILKH